MKDVMLIDRAGFIVSNTVDAWPEGPSLKL